MKHSMERSSTRARALLILLATISFSLLSMPASCGQLARDDPYRNMNGSAFTSGNGYYAYDRSLRGECTWYVYGRCAEVGWNIGYTGPADGYYKNVQNRSGQGLVPVVGAIMCTSGHVSYVVQVINNNQWVVDEYNEWPAYQHQWSRQTIIRNSNNLSLVKGDYHTWYSLTGFIYPPSPTPQPVANGLVPLYRYSNSRGHSDRFYTTNFAELGNGGFAGWTYEGVAGRVYLSQAPGTVPLYRYVNPSLGLHFYTVQKVDLSRIGYRTEGIQCYVYPNNSPILGPAIMPWYRYHNVWNDSHFYTMNFNELGRGGGAWVYEGAECQLVPNP